MSAMADLDAAIRGTKPGAECDEMRAVSQRDAAYRRMIFAAAMLRTTDYLAAKMEYRHWCRASAKFREPDPHDNTGDDGE